MEARGERASLLNRKCVLVRWVDLSSERLLDLLHRGAGSVLVLLPPTATTSLGEEEEEVGGASEESLVQVRGGREGGRCLAVIRLKYLVYSS